MPSVTQTIDNYYAGMSQQPDMKKYPGQVKDIINGIPDPIEGLMKRPGSKRIGSTPLANVQAGGSWFHYFRDETEGSYIGQVANDGKVRIWSCTDGTEKDVWYHTDNSQYSGGNSDHTSITSYLKTEFEGDYTRSGTTVTVTADANHGLSTGNVVRMYFTGAATDGEYEITKTGDTTFTLTDSVSGTIGSTSCTFVKPKGTEDIQALTINDTTFLNNRDRTVGTTGTTATREHDHFAFIEVMRTENGRQYALNLYSNENTTNVTRATRLRKTADTLSTAKNTGSCRGIGTQVFSASSKNNYSDPIVDVENSSGSSYDANDNKNNLIFRINTLGQNHRVEGGSNTDQDDFACTYSVGVTLLHGGENYVVGDQVKVKMTEAKGGAGTSVGDTTKAEYTIRVEETETVAVKANIKAVRPAPTPFDAQTAVTIDTIIGGITDQISGTSITAVVIGNGIYLHSNSAFSVEVPQQDLMRVMQESVNNVADLPMQCRDGYIVKVANSSNSNDDDYYLKFVGNDGLDGPGTWVECPGPGIMQGLNPTTMPHVLQRQADGAFLVKKYTWEPRAVGDDSTNAMPSFVNKKINKVLFFRNRLALISGENVILSRPGELAEPSFFSKTAIAVSAVDPIDISCSSTFPSDLFDGIEVAAGLAVFSTNQQFLLSSDAEILNPDTAKLRSITTYNYNKDIPPISLGVTVGYIDNSGKYSRFNEMAGIIREQEPIVIETSKIVPTLLEKDIDLLTNSRENSIVLFGKTDSDIICGYKYFQSGEERKQQAWFKWKLNNPLKYHFIINDEYYVLDTDNFLQKISLMQQDTDVSINENSINYLIHLDNWTTVGNGSYDANTKLTTFANQSDWIDQVTSPNGSLVIVDVDTGATRIGRYGQCTVTNTDDFTVPGDWSTGTFYIGYLYEYSVSFPKFYLTRVEGAQAKSDVNSSLVVHRVKLNFGKSGLYATTLQRVGKDDYTEVYESTFADDYLVSDAPYVQDQIQTVPVYEANNNVNLLLKSSHPAPATLQALSWEGDYSPRNYKRV